MAEVEGCYIRGGEVGGGGIREWEDKGGSVFICFHHLLLKKHLYITSKQIVLQGSQVLKLVKYASKPEQPGPSRLIRLEAVCTKS